MPEQATRPEQVDERARRLRDVVRKYHVHFDVLPELMIRGGERRRVGYELRLWAVHPKGARALPGCDGCRELFDALRRLAAEVLPPEGRATRCVVEPPRAALYASGIVDGADEVSVSVRLIHRSAYEEPVDACEERCLRELRQALKGLGARET